MLWSRSRGVAILLTSRVPELEGGELYRCPVYHVLSVSVSVVIAQPRVILLSRFISREKCFLHNDSRSTANNEELSIL
ncbi:hypothetical protein OUZ56_020374 [Daphnia magna]|uniref:Uncharacterized protein n=1 Tax=Daphnia magna TaxID=35525 RepID=A0ABQ9ZEC0_9CRUS|nr:hypothetical protein OUZ56_020374 [Daphnia magna]